MKKAMVFLSVFCMFLSLLSTATAFAAENEGPERKNIEMESIDFVPGSGNAKFVYRMASWNFSRTVH